MCPSPRARMPPKSGARQPPGAQQVDLQQLAEACFAGGFQRPEGMQSGVVDKHVDAAGLPAGLLHRAIHRRLRGNVQEDFTCADIGGQSAGLAYAGEHGVSACGEFPGGGQAQAAGRSADEHASRHDLRNGS